MIYEHAKLSWNINTGKHIIHPTELSGNPTGSHLVAKQEEIAKDMMNFEGYDEFCLMNYIFQTSKVSLTYRKILLHGANGFTSPRKEGMNAAHFYHP
jgi:hypothetical protein